MNMPQAIIERYFPTKRARHSTPSPLLALPRTIRERIFVLANLCPDRFTDLNRWARRKHCPSSDSVEEPDCHTNVYLWGQRDYEKRNPPDAIPISLLLVCKTISQEARDLLYGRNCFAISHRNPGGLRALKSLSRHAVKNLKRLIIHLTPCTCLTPHCVKFPRQSPHVARSFCNLFYDGCDTNTFNKQPHDRRLSDTSRTDKHILKQWGTVCRRLAGEVVPGQLALYIVCHVESLSVADHLIHPLLLLPILRNCGICLGPSSHTSFKELQALGTTAVQRLTSTPVPALQRPFPFLRLPRELQLQVLAETPLVQEVCIHISDGKFSKHNLSHSCESASICIDGEAAITLAGFCTKKCAAFRTGCDNATSATYLTRFCQVGKEFAAVATDVFFSHNTFTIHTWYTGVGSEDERNLEGMHEILARLSPQALAQIRRLTILLPPIDKASFVDGKLREWSPIWQKSMQLLGAKATLPALALTIKIGHYQSDYEGDARDEQFTEEHNGRGASFQVYEDVVVRPLMQWRTPPKHLFVHVSYPFGRANEAARVEVERRLERLVMGLKYDAYDVGKGGPDEYTRPFLRDWYQ